MDITTVVVGVLVIGAGCFFLTRSLRPDAASGKLKAMLEMWGSTRGLWLYRIAYVGIPWFFGGTLVYAGLRGVSLARFFS